MTATSAAAGYVTPEVIRQNTRRLVICQMLSGAANQLVFALGPLMVVTLLGSAAFAGLSVALHGVSRFIAAYPFGHVTDRYGRRPGMLLGLSLALVGTLLVGTSMGLGSFPGFVVGLLVLGTGMNGVQQLRLAAAEMYPPERRALVLGYVLTLSVVGVIASPLLIGLGEILAPVLRFDALALPWLFVPALILPAMVLVHRVRPDPREIARDLGRYYPGQTSRTPEVAPPQGGFGLRRYLARPERRLAAITMFSAQGSMQIAMVTAPLALTHHGVTLPAVALSMAIHTAGMFGPSLPMGWLADRVGRRFVLIFGTIIEAVGGGIAAFTTAAEALTLGIFLVGLGWCAANIASTALVIDSTEPAVRGRAIGLTDTIAAVAGVALPVCVGPILDAWGLGATGVLAMALMVPPAVLLVTTRRLPRMGMATARS